MTGSAGLLVHVCQPEPFIYTGWPVAFGCRQGIFSSPVCLLVFYAGIVPDVAGGNSSGDELAHDRFH